MMNEFKDFISQYKVMGMAPFGEPKYQDRVHKLIRIATDGSFELDMDYFAFHYSRYRQAARQEAAQVLGAPGRARRR